MIGPARPDLDAVARTLRATQRAFARIERERGAERDPMDDVVVANLLAGYRYVDILIERHVDLFVRGNSKALLELNTIVLCGPDPDNRAVFASHLSATEQRFYDQVGGGVQDVVEWYERHADESLWHRAAGVHTRMLASPQLFVEGNHRTAALVMSYVLLREGYPPFVLTPDDADAYFEAGAAVRRVDRNSAAVLVQLPRIKRRLALVLAGHADRRYLCR